MITRDDIEEAIEAAVLNEGAELQLVLDSGMTYCVYRKRSRAGSVAFYTADESQMAGPSGRRHVTRLKWDCKPAPTAEVPTDPLRGVEGGLGLGRRRYRKQPIRACRLRPPAPPPGGSGASGPVPAGEPCPSPRRGGGD